MASNPMQRKTRNSFLLGMVITLLITGAVIALLLLMLQQKTQEIQKITQETVSVYVLNQDVKSAQTLTLDMFDLEPVDKNTIPINAIPASQAYIMDTWYLQTKEGEPACRDGYGLYLDKSGANTKINVIVEVTEDIIEGEKAYFLNIEGQLKQIEPTGKVYEDTFGKYYIDTKEENAGKMRVYRETATDKYYIYEATDENNDGQVDVRNKKYLEINNVPVLAKVNMNARTVITGDLVVQSDEVITSDTRQVQYNMITLPVDLMTNDYVDIRLKVASGQNFIIASKVQVEIPMNADGTYIADTVKVNLREDEILAMSSAIVEAYGLKGSELYMSKYVEPAMQDAAIPTYVPNAVVTTQIDANGDGKIDNPNIVENAKLELAKRYSAAASAARNQHLQQLINDAEVEVYYNNIGTSVEEQIGASITARQKYLESLNY